MNLQDLIVYLILFLCIWYAGKHFLKFFRRKSSSTTGCGCGCSGCSMASKQNTCSEKKTKK
ncbi:FeoB-associated Cys-rich membrane protein [Phocaeicola coprophilus]|uniref:FeoB-associated Cys-rich membrane protein n=1 Tax=Phocaeicola coprophilus TaxID=387090 RepID=A0A413T1P2_9BACT|nr:FeoB-associated Cys-rich membrane protein [Phocaeicola coprophilus]QRO26301.1 FeoB-associated Cys-rich membrane protein [Phocaeicola coprophilus]RHA76909.1 FeoB-associated Cys-rich membrane protein [Phocaeicola coprophilus]HJE47417.1 FeoB-associated Cys-rich membrane protein [Phocaeicola coprophilus]